MKQRHEGIYICILKVDANAVSITSSTALQGHSRSQIRVYWEMKLGLKLICLSVLYTFSAWKLDITFNACVRHLALLQKPRDQLT